MRRTLLKVTYDGTDISEDISERLINFSYNDNKAGEADDIEITVENRDGIWLGDWYPDKESKLTAGLKLTDWGGIGSVDFGTFTIDELSASSGGAFVIKAVSSVCEGALKHDIKFKQWENVTMKEVVSEIASANGLKLIWKASIDPVHERIYQIEQSDAAFIMQICANIGIKLKISQEGITAYESAAGDSGLTLKPEDLASWSFRSKTFSTYSAAQIEYTDPVTNETIAYTNKDENIAGNRTLILNEEAKTREEAERKAAAALRTANEREITGSLEMIGNPYIWSALDIKLEGFGAYSGAYVIESARHSVDRGGYKTTAEVILKKDV